MSKARQLADLGNVYDGAFSNRNVIINGAMIVDQRNGGAAYTLSGSAAFSADRFKVWGNVSSGSTVQVVSDAPSGFTKSIKLTVGTGATPASTDYGRVFSAIEGYNWAQMRWGFSDAKDVTLSFWVKSSVTGTFGVGFTSGLDYYYVSSYTVNSASTWEYKTVTVSGLTSGGTTQFPINNTVGTGLIFDLGEGSSRSNTLNTWTQDGTYSKYGLTGGVKILATSGATWQITGVQLEIGDTSTPFEHEPYSVTLQKCQRYYYSNTSTSQFYATQYVDTYKFVQWGHPVRMRATPTPTVTYFTGSFSPYQIDDQHFKAYVASSYTDGTTYYTTSYAMDAEL